MKPLTLLLMVTLFASDSFAQKQTFDLLTYTVPKGWDQQTSSTGVQLSTKDPGNGQYAAAVIVGTVAAIGTSTENFHNNCEKLVKGTVTVHEKPAMQEPQRENGWDIISGQANYTDGSNKGLVTLITASANGKMISVILLTNSANYQDDLLSFINSIELAAPPKNETKPPASVATEGKDKTSVIGLWTDNNLETTGSFVNGMPQYTAGYRRKEYAFYPDGTYLFRTKQWITLMKEILYIYETGTYSVSGDQLTIIPSKGRGGWWSKSQNNTKLWGKLVKAAEFPLEKVTYSFGIKYYSGSQQYALILRSGKTTARDGGRSNAPSETNEYSYTFREKSASLIDNPPGFKTGFENKPFTSSAQP
ncbi:hypothetical protein HHL16_23960 [Pseudoflavitalea sp. G-6-1-2]|uniref:hypothetical protein n=1 Tax=Pseudoflavitalea sp. G-6-1-2 TaxID=2728841 RepID=UPI00146D5922|nr:hypothetical protein [Pseudoflavitalea sp. G-6-1-2]NML23958.1 hypothetical protein [Pseudoflavitalea sp. G-6-1-2]